MTYDAYFWILTGAGALCFGAGLVLFFMGKGPNDISFGGAGLVFAATLVYLVASLIRPVAGDPPRGSVPEFWAYMLSQLLIPVAGVWWALAERNRWSNLILAVVGFTAFAMAGRMNQIWYGVAGLGT